MTARTLHISQPFPTEGGAVLPELHIAYHTWGKPNAEQDNIVWITHALTGNSDAASWWPGLVGEGRLLDPDKYFIVCANVIGSCYGSTGPTSIDPRTGQAYGLGFPLITIRDMVRAHRLLQRHLGIRRIRLGIGGSMGGQQIIEWAAAEPELFDRIALLATNARHSPWGIAFNESQRMAIMADPTVQEKHPEAGAKGLEAARAVAILSYRHYHTYHRTQLDPTHDKIEDFLAGSYQRYQGEKLRNRFHAHSYLTLSRAMDSHNVGRGRESVENALAQIRKPALVVAIQSDVLFPPEEQYFIGRNLPEAQVETIESLYGHDGFLIEYDKIAPLLQDLLERNWTTPAAKKPSDHKQETRPSAGSALPGSERI